MEYRTLRNGQKISTIGIGVGNYSYENVPLEEIEIIFRTAFDKGGIEIPSVNRYYDLAKAGDPLAFEHYKNLAVHTDACAGCKNCAGECPFHVDMPSRMKEIAEYFHSM